MKTCSSCKIEKVFEDFHSNKAMKDGFAHYCKECKKESQSKHRAKNLEKVKDRSNSWKKQNSERVKFYQKEYRQLNDYKFCQYQSKRRSKMKTVLTKKEQDEINHIYWLAKDLKAVTGEDYHVDHIKPLSKGGLHHPENLQVLPADLNLKKGARYEEST